MTAREIRVFGDPVLRAKCAPVEQIDAGVRSLIADLIDSVKLPAALGSQLPRSVSRYARSATTSTATSGT